MRNTDRRLLTHRCLAAPRRTPDPAASAGLVFAWVLASLVLLGLLAAGGLSAWLMIGRQATALQQQTANTNRLEQAVHALEQAASDVDGDGTLEAPAFKTGAFAPTGGGNLPDSVAAAKTDAWGHLLGYCSWDHGNLTSSTNRSAGDNSPLQSDAVFAVISAGPDGVFQTSCANLKAGTVNGDDEARPLTLAELHQAVGGNVFMGEPVASQTTLASLNNPQTGEIHLAKDTNTLYQWNGSAWQSIGTTASTTLPGKNLFINGNFDIWQRGTSFSANSPIYTADRWVDYTTSGTVTVSRQPLDLTVSPHPTFATYLLQISAPSGVPYFELNQPIEHVMRYGNQTFTFSFWARVTSGSFQILPCVYLYFGSGGSPSSSINQCATNPVTLTTTWQRFSQTFTTPDLSGDTVGTNGDDYLQFSLGSYNQTTATTVVQFAQLQAEAGAVATSYDLRPVGQELYDCMRYYEVYTTKGTSSSPDFSGYVDGSGNPIIRNIRYRVPKRTTPTVTLVGHAVGSNLAASGFSVYSPGTRGFQLQIWGNSAGMVTASQSWIADAEF